MCSAETFPPWSRGPRPAGEAADLYRCWPTADGHIAIVIIEDHQFQAICRVVEREDLARDERYAGIFQRIVNAEELFRLFETELRKWPTASWSSARTGSARRWRRSTGSASCSPIQQVAANRTVFETEDRAAGRMRLLRNPVRFAARQPVCAACRRGSASTPTRCCASRVPRRGGRGAAQPRRRGVIRAEDGDRRTTPEGAATKEPLSRRLRPTWEGEACPERCRRAPRPSRAGVVRAAHQEVRPPRWTVLAQRAGGPR